MYETTASQVECDATYMKLWRQKKVKCNALYENISSHDQWDATGMKLQRPKLNVCVSRGCKKKLRCIHTETTCHPPSDYTAVFRFFSLLVL